MRQFNFDELKSRSAQASIQVAQTMRREDMIRRRPRDPIEVEILGELIARRVQRARETGELKKAGGKLTIRL